jgi:hypothetical protein
MTKSEKSLRDILDESENKAGGLLAAPSSETIDIREFVDQVNKEYPLDVVEEEEDNTIDFKRRFLAKSFEQSAQAMTLAARNFDKFPDEAIEALYEEAMDLKKRADENP